VLTGEADGRPQAGSGSAPSPVPSAINGSGYYEVDAVREDSPPEKVAGRGPHLPPSPLTPSRTEVTSCSRRATPWVMIPLRGRPDSLLQGSGTLLFMTRAQTAHGRAHHPDPRGSRAADERHPQRYGPAVRLRPPSWTRWSQQMSGYPRRSRRFDTICVGQDRHADQAASSSSSRFDVNRPLRGKAGAQQGPRPVRRQLPGERKPERSRRSPRTTRRAGERGKGRGAVLVGVGNGAGLSFRAWREPTWLGGSGRG